MDRLSVREKSSYGIGEIASNIIWMTIMFFLAIFYTDTFGIPASVVGTMFIVVRLFDGINDPVMGIIADRTTTKWGKYRPYLLWMAIPYGIGGIIMFITPDFGLTGKIIYAYSTYILMMIIYTAIMIPFSALSGVMTSSADDRTSLNSYRFVGAFVGGLFIQGLALFMVTSLGEDNESIIQASLVNDKIIVHEENIGNVKLTLSAVDANGSEAFDEFTFKICRDGENPPSVISAIKDTNVNKGFGEVRFDLNEVFIDVDNEELVFTADVTGNAVDATVNNSTLTVKENSVGSANVRVTATDAIEGQVNINFEVLVSEDGNSNPVVSVIPNEKKLKINTEESIFSVTKLIGIKEKETIDIADVFSDPDDDELKIKVASSNDEILSAKLAGDKIIVKKKMAGSVNLTLSAYDGNGGKAITELPIQLIPLNGQMPPYKVSKVQDYRVAAGFGSMDINITDIFRSNSNVEYNLEVVNSAKGYQTTMMIFGLLCVVLFLITFVNTKERVKPISNEKSKLSDDFKDLLKNTPWLILFLVSLVSLIYVGLRSAVIAYYFEYYVGDSGLTSAFLVIGSLVIILSLSLTKWMTKYIEKKTLYVICAIVIGLSILGYSFVDSDDIFLIFFLQILQSFASGPTMPLLWSMLADTADYNEWKTGRKAMGLAYSASTFAQKAGIALGGALAMWMLAGYGYQANVEQTETALSGMKMMMGTYPAIGAFICGVIIWFYSLDRRKMEQIEIELNERRKNFSGE